MTTSTGTFETKIKSLSAEILLKIFLCLDSHETVILRSVCKEFVEIIDNHKSLWRILEWKQSEEESPIPALEMFDEKSASTLKEVSIFQAEGRPDDRFIGVLDRSKNSLRDLSFTIRLLTQDFRLRLMDLASNCHHLESLVLWTSETYQSSLLPKTRLTRSSRQPYLGTERPRELQVLWGFNLLEDWNRKLDVSSLVSFADSSYQHPLRIRSVISNFSQGIIHLSISPLTSAIPQAVSFPSLRILEGRFPYGFPSWIDAPNLQMVIANSANNLDFFPQLPVSVEELWLFNWNHSGIKTNLDPLSQVCPHLKILKLGRELFDSDLRIQGISEILGARKDKVKKGAEIEGTKMKSLEKPILPFDLFESAEVDQLRGLVGEVIDIEDYPDFIELEY